MRHLGKALLVISLLIIGGCTTQPQQVVLNPVVELIPSKIGQQTSVQVKVIDQRPQQALGVRGDTHSALITTNQALAAVFDNEIKKGLVSKGFVISDKASGTSTLLVTINELNYKTLKGSLTDEVQIKGAIKVQAKKHRSELNKVYEYEREDEVLVEPGVATNEKWINEALSETLKRLLNDKELLRFLAAK
ncbi:YajG family lipoprotein [Neptunicella sp. SCSIO 80796]|uniref:YajG family lipoprotein n=1 Tax=Neptunicella plasticusilytica TaxID=3117012 RepID=UPI003A4E4B3B